VSHYHLRPLVEEIGGQEGEHVHEQLGGADDDEQYNEQEGNAEAEQEAAAGGAQQVVEEAHEVPAVRGVRDPGQPTREERARHDLTHLPFRPWCADCVAGRAADDPHRRAAREEDDGPTKVSVDYGFISEKVGDAEVQRTILVMKVGGYKVVMARCVQGKGRADPHAVGWLVDQLRRLGISRCVLQADGEPAQRTFVKDVLEETARTTSLGIASAHTPAHDHQCNGGVEKAIRDVKDQVRVMRCALARSVGAAVPLASPIMDWLVAWAAELITGARIGQDGMTAYRRLRGREWQPRVAEFAEQVLARRPRALLQGDAEPRWDQVTYLGSRWGSAEHWVAGEDGTARRVRAIRRKPLAERWSAAQVLSVTGLPDHPGCRDGGAEAPAPEVGVIPHAEADGEPGRLTRGFRINAEDLREHGYTQRCAKCDALRAGREVGTGHSAACRGRFAAIFVDRADGRVERAIARRDPDAAGAGPEAAPEGDEAMEGQASDEELDDAPSTPRAWAGSDLDVAPNTPVPVTPNDSDADDDIDDDVQLGRVAAAPARWADVYDNDDDEEADGPWADLAQQGAATRELTDDIVRAVNVGALRPIAVKERIRRICQVSGMDEGETRKTVAELFSPPRVNAELSKDCAGSIAAGTSFDLIIDRESGETWDFLNAAHRRRCWSRLRAEDPWVIIGSPPCTAFSIINGLNKFKVAAETRERKLVEGKVLLNFALDVYMWQHRRGKYFVHEHPQSASSWSLPEVRAVQCLDGVTSIVNDACVFGMTAIDRDGTKKPVKKPTRWMSNAPALLRHLAGRCVGKHPEHTQLLGGRAAKAAVYPPGLVLAIVRGLQAQREEDHAMGRGPCPLSGAVQLATATPAWRSPTVYDEYSGEPLNDELAKRAKEEELQYFHSKGVWRVVPRAHAAGQRVIGTRWVSCNKGDVEHPEIRCRLVCQEVKTYQSEEFFAATPPLETLRMVLSMAADDHRMQVTLVDISRAYFNAYIAREVYVELPREAGHGKDVVGKLVKCMYGTRDAAQGWEDAYRTALEAMGFRRGRASPCVFSHVDRQVFLTVHGDDFLATGSAASLTWFEHTLLTTFEGKVKGRLQKPGDELRILNRIARRTENGYEWEADQRHAELIIASAGLDSESKPLSNPGRKLAGKELDEPDLLGAEAASEYRARAARANFLASDRPDVAFAVKELCRGMSAPTVRDQDALKRLARYLLGRPRVVFHYAWQQAPACLDVYTDSDWAGCVKTRKSTTGGALMRGSHVLKTWSHTQATIALSSAEAELIAAVKGAAEGLAVRSLVQDFGRDCALRIHVDSSAAIGICRRTGVGKVRHLDTRLLWIQELVRDGTLEVIKIAGIINPADLMTKHLAAEAISANLARLGCFECAGRSELAPRCI
jgi:hypothetical protein